MAIVPDVARRLVGPGIEVVVQAGAGRCRPLPRRRLPGGRRLGRRRRRRRRGRGGRGGPGPAPDRRGGRRPAPRGSRWSASCSRRPRPTRSGPWPTRAPPSSASTCCPGSAGPSPWTPCRRRRRSRGYRAGLAAAEHLAKFFPMFMTAAGTVPPAKVLVMGVGVAGLQAIATARRLGAVVRAYDVRAAAKEEVQSLGATFVELGLETQEGSGGYAREQSAEEPGPPAGAAGRRGGGGRRGDHHRRRPGPARPRCWSPRPWSSGMAEGRWWSTWRPTRAATAS